jgi:hypothetical protein
MRRELNRFYFSGDSGFGWANPLDHNRIGPGSLQFRDGVGNS